MQQLCGWALIPFRLWREGGAVRESSAAKLMTTPTVPFVSHSAADTCRLAETLAPWLESGDFVALVGPLGAGKTCFVQGLGQALGVRQGVRSPTFVLLHQYRVGGAVGVLHHFDLYRLEGPHQLDDLGYDDIVYGDGVSVVEWPDRSAGRWPADRLTVRFEIAVGVPDGRQITVEAEGPRSTRILHSLEAVLS